MDDGYGARYRELFERHWWWRARERVILRALEEHRPPKGWRTVLDVGCGDGLFFDRLSELDGVELVDLFGHGEHALPATLDLDPYDARWYRVRREGVRLPP